MFKNSLLPIAFAFTFAAIVTHTPHRAMAETSADGSNTEPWFQTESKFHGYRRLETNIADRAAYIVLPAEPAAGNPWVWRARFPSFHAEVDVKLLAEGFHIGYVDVAGLFGSPAAMEIGDQFYDFAVNDRGLNPKPVLEGVSRGGLFVYNYLVRHPDRVTAVYADTPVCDFNSWPGGKGTGRGSAKDWKRCLQTYGIDEAEAKSFTVTPVGQAKQIAASGVPLLHIISENDTIVPPPENTNLLRQKIEKHGGRLDVISVPEGTAVSGGHHFTHPAVDQVFQFIVHHVERQSHQSDETKDVDRMAMLRSAKRIAFLGDSITYGGQYVAAFEAWLRTQIPADEMPTIINVGLPSETVSGLSEEGHAGGRFPRPDVDERTDRVIQTVKPDLVFACYGMNCGIYKPESADRLAAFEFGITRLHEKLATSGAAVIHLTPAAYDDQRSKLEFSYNNVLRSFADSLIGRRSDGWIVIDTHAAMTQALETRRKLDLEFHFARDSVHPNAAGHWVLASTLIRWFGDDRSANAPNVKTMLKNNAAPTELSSATSRRMQLLRDAYLTKSGHKRPGVKPGLPVNEAIQKADDAVAQQQDQ